MSKPTFDLKTNFKHDNKLRKAFIDLSIEVFDLNFEPWYQSGAWDQTYEPFTYFDGEKAVANVSVSHMTLIINGHQYSGLQVGTVMTHPDYRRQGLAKSLFHHIFSIYPPNQYQYFLAADDEAVPLYQAVGFKHWPEVAFNILLDPPSHDNAPLPTIQASRANLSARELASLKSAKPITNAALQVIHDESILKFYYVMGFDQIIHEISGMGGEPLGYALLEADGHILKVYDYYQHVDENQLAQLARIWGFRSLKLMYTPSKDAIASLNRLACDVLTPVDPQSQWMVHAEYENIVSPIAIWPPRARFPKLSQT